MHEGQTHEYVQEQVRSYRFILLWASHCHPHQLKKWMRFDHAKLTMLEALDMLNDFVDASDPDVSQTQLLFVFSLACTD
jgi:hypothetical protein